ncbi:diacylglycerol/lipid kinase family protein [Aureibacter tunicatorum]|uniref:YegS/Rv2252/BmrU family lipid kinase n=1 Tax=Aureibacter tunicatorum TaxID=866807 RepID=A0AAE3XN38_9BACT|nr:diacylglycerol kinase family lipid kinase [Aureibacter tunicatorum]MDR6239628.1 YegS/Rv2252/BmrU family lipid kinase [Aureibacter tunicatorum]BDD04104.1 hypothetical protein AUTU_15870 [Aureibacter tunicatorum]
MKILFLINPTSGTKTVNHLKEKIEEVVNTDFFTPEIVYTEYRGHAEVLAQNAANENYHAVIAVGGDGTVNEVARSLVHTDTALGIIPKGSGNGLARSLNIPLDIEKAIQRLNENKIDLIDAGLANEKHFFCTAGIGFDAEIGKAFEMADSRGLKTYVSESIKHFFSYEPKHYTILTENGKIETKAFLLTIANAGQYGNDFYVSPHAKLSDGLLDLCILKPFALFETLPIGIQFLTKTIDKNKHMSITKVHSIDIECDNIDCYHIDGEFQELSGNQLRVSTLPKCLKVIH